MAEDLSWPVRLTQRDFQAMVTAGAEELNLFLMDPQRVLTRLPPAVLRLTRLRSLRLGTSPLTALPSWLSELPALETIDARAVELSSVPELEKAYLAVNAETLWRCRGSSLRLDRVYAVRITSRTSPEALQHLTRLADEGRLSLSSLGVISTFTKGDGMAATAAQWRADLGVVMRCLERVLESQPYLQELRIIGYPLQHVPEAMRRLTALTHLSLIGVWPPSLPDWLFELPRLTSLDLVHNDLSRLPAAVERARELTSLDLSYNTFGHVPDGVWELPRLTRLDLSCCPLEWIPADILHLDHLTELNLTYHGEQHWLQAPIPPSLVVPPPEVAANGLEAIKSYWLQRREAGQDYLSEAKLLIVGEPGAGKTSLAKKILNPLYALRHTEETTEGIDVFTWRFPAVVRVVESEGERLLERDFRVNIWDFGGQEIYHATHQFFLTKRSVYVLVSDERREDTDFQYWLEVVNLLSGGSPLLVVQNRKHGRTQALDLGTLRQAYPNLVGTLSLDLSDNSGLEAAVGRIRRELESLPHIGTALPKTWRDVRTTLEKNTRDYITAEEFFGICRAHGFVRADDMRQLGGFLHDLGICLYFQDDPLLRKTVILKPEWGTGAVYRVLDDEEIINAHGVFGRAALQRIWHEPMYQDMHDELIRLMVKFALCYPVPGSDIYVAPQLLTPTKPEYDWEDRGSLSLRYEYAVMPKGIVRRVIVELHDLIEGDAVWRTGVVLAYRTSRAEIVEDYHRRRLRLRVTGPDRHTLLAVIDRALVRIHRSYPEIRVTKYRPCDCEVCAVAEEPTMFAIAELADFARTDDRIQCRASRRMMDPKALLADLPVDETTEYTAEPAGGMREGKAAAPKAPPEVFVSYKRGGTAERLVDEIERRLSGRGMQVRRDKNEVRYRDPIRAYMRRLGAGKSVIVIIDQEYLRSKYCMFELTEIAARPEFARRVFPIVLPDANLFDPLAQVSYVRFWERKAADLNQAMLTVRQNDLQGIREDLDLYQRIRTVVAGILDLLADMVALAPDHRGVVDFDQLIRALEEHNGR
ncbi:COR domain-containing protein [Actinoplanes sp. NPDC049681]|uniref:COR domain-containing protein n=1 Tax=Actinoplanes sp. NPDC049681 TaxID=3363905 RepID=UPI00379B8DC4